MAKGDMKVIGQCMRQPFRIAASATRGYVGEPMINTATHTSGVASSNVIVVAVDDDVTVVTEQFVGILAKDMEVTSPTDATIVAHRTVVDMPFAQLTRIEAKAKTASTADTESEAIGLLHDIYMIDLTSSVYTWEPAGADTAAFTVAWYNVARSALQCTVDARGVSRKDIT